MFKKIFHSRTKTVTFAALLVGLSALISRLLGLWRDRLLAGTFGAGEDLDVYFAAFRIPDFVFGIIITGGISAIFLPVLSEYFKKSEPEGWKLASNVLNCFLAALVFLCGLLAIFTPWLINLIAPGFNVEQKALAIVLTRIMFLSPVFLGISAIFSGVLQYFDKFFAYSLAPVLYNLGIIFGILVLAPIFGLNGLVYGVILGAFLHLLVQVPAAQAVGFKFLPLFNFKAAGLAKIFKLMVPRIVGTAAYHINLIVVTAIASTLTVGSIAIFNFSNNLQYFPIGIVGTSFALAAFPTLSRAWVNGQKKDFLDNFSSVFRQIIFLIVPVSILIFLLRAQLTRLILGTGNFGWEETRLTAACLGFFCLGIFATSLVPLLARAFYSFQNTKTPVAIGLVSMTLNVILSFVLVANLQDAGAFKGLVSNALKLQGIENIAVLGLPLALSVSAVFQFSLLVYFLRRRLGHIRLKEILRSSLKILAVSILMAVAAYLILQALAGFFSLTTFWGILWQTALTCFFGVFIYLLVAYLWRFPEARTIKHSIFKQFSHVK